MNCPKCNSEYILKMVALGGRSKVNLSPYSREFSQIENFWSKVKFLLRKLKARNYLDLIDSITDAMIQVTKKDIHNWLVHCCYCTS